MCGHRAFAFPFEAGAIDPCIQFPAPPGVFFQLATVADGDRVVAVGRIGIQFAVYRFFSNGELDVSFHSNFRFSGTLNAIRVAPNGTVYLVGNFDAPNRGILLRLGSDGELDETFLPVSADGEGRAVAVTPAGRILLGGSFTQLNSQPHARLALLNSDGSFVETFDLKNGFGLRKPGRPEVRSLLVLAENSFLVGGGFSFYQDVPSPGLVRMDDKATLDPNFVPEINHAAGNDENQTYSIARLESGDFIVAGQMLIRNGQPSQIVRLTAEGSLDPEFGHSIVDHDAKPPTRILIDSKNRILTSDGDVKVHRISAKGIGDIRFLDPPMSSFAGILGDRIVGLQKDGSMIGVFMDPTGSEEDRPPTILVSSVPQVYLTEGFSFSIQPTVLGNPPPTLQWQLNDVPISGATNGYYFSDYTDRTHLGLLSLVASNRLGSTKTLVTTLTATLHDRSAGMIDTTVRFDDLPIVQVQALEAVPRGGILVGGERTPRFGKPGMDLVWLTESNTVDPNFVFHSDVTLIQFHALKALTNGWTVVSADVRSSLGATQQVILWLDTTGQVQTTTHLEGGPARRIYEDASSHVWVVGDFIRANDQTRNRVAVFSDAGVLTSIASEFPLPDDTVRALVQDRLGFFWMAGDFQSIGGIPRGRIARLKPDGSLDLQTDFGIGFDGPVSDLISATPDRIWVGGSFTHYRGDPIAGLMRFDLDGNPDPMTNFANVSRFTRDARDRIWFVCSSGGVRLGTDGVWNTNGLLNPSPNSDYYQMLTVSREGRVYAAGSISDRLGYIRWTQSLAQLLDEDQTGINPPRFLSEPVGHLGLSSVFCPSIEGHQLDFFWYEGDRLQPTYHRSDIAQYVPNKDLEYPFRLVVCNPSGCITSAPITLTSDSFDLASLRPPPARVVAMKGQPLTIYAKSGVQPLASTTTAQWLFGLQPIHSVGDVLVIPEVNETHQGCYSWLAANSYQWLQTGFQIQITTPESWNEALNTLGLTYFAFPQHSWAQVQLTENGIEPFDAVATNPMGAGQMATFGVYIYGSGQMRFRWKLTRTSTANRFGYRINDGPFVELTPVADWNETVISVKAGTLYSPSVRWFFFKQEGDPNSGDTAIVDWIKITDYVPARFRIVRNPTPVQVDGSGTVELAGVVDGTPPFTYQWFKDGSAIDGATNSFFFSPASLTPDGNYSLQIRSGASVLETPSVPVSIIPTIPVLKIVEVSDGQFELSVKANPAAVLSIERSTDFTAWEPLGTLPSGNVTRTQSLQRDEKVSRQYFRVRTL